MKYLYLHVGPHKTGTTAIQKFMLDNQSVIFKKGILYPKRYMRIFGQHLFRDKLSQRTLDEEDIAFFKDSECDFVISSEDLISLNKSDFTYLKQSLPFLQVRVIYSWRRASFKLYSIWQEVIKHGGTQDFFAYYHEHLARPAMSQMLSPDLKLSMFATVFGKENIIVIDYDASAKHKRLLEDFLTAICLDSSDSELVSALNSQTVQSNVRNQSMSVEDVETVRALNYILSDKASDGTVRSFYQQHIKALSQEDLLYVHNRIKEYISPERVGNYAVDVRAEKIMVQQYSEQLINYEPNTKNQEAAFPATDWLLDFEVHACLERLAHQLSEYISVPDKQHEV
ncbi:hypothetical protein PN836_007305 [Ningiella sp. W23]|uniref:hypothetical protein n=1 Tax=Ningiella sp. W23 TaxID=3023715 RepID=UPI003756753B